MQNGGVGKEFRNRYLPKAIWSNSYGLEFGRLAEKALVRPIVAVPFTTVVLNLPEAAAL